MQVGSGEEKIEGGKISELQKILVGDSMDRYIVNSFGIFIIY